MHQDVRFDGSRIEASHKGWVAIMHGMPSGIAVTVALAYDFVHCRNCHIDINNKTPHEFSKSLHGSHHTLLANETAHLWNALLEKEKTITLLPLPLLVEVNSGESFGLLEAKQPASFKGLLELKEEDKDGEVAELTKFDCQVDPEDIERMLSELNINPVLLNQPAMHPIPTPVTAITSPPDFIPSTNVPSSDLADGHALITLGKGKCKAEDLVDLTQEDTNEAVEVVQGSEPLMK